MNNKLTDEEITELVLKLFDGSSFYFQSGRRPGAKTMAELLNKAACAVAELQERRQADKNYFMYGIAEPDGSAYLDEVCVSRDVSLLQSIVDELNISDGTDGYRVVALYTVLPLTDNERELVTQDGSEDSKRLDWLDSQNKRLNEYYGTSYGWKFDANFQRNAMMLNDSNYPVMTVRQAIDEAIAAATKKEGA
ncbi:TPA_asm: hypothetical protein G0E04_12880 [Salmonella enterica subsp. enterica serovar Napoli]|uniref:Uncharacterized protein n=1 Tax=Salmonella enterica subsp. enterica serovar Napoli TaxID=1151001 RepID=A0A751UP97_SALET|nr:hypothetical protein [Salmonella enterica subsp. enterica serovar Coeln]HAC7044961.1 hypothetical protein [Salmonella enterica subsp. enterica serovar Napoli]HAF7194065.1 hypothetical protein [Salmonella enterica subsp. enterica serovar Napoli]